MIYDLLSFVLYALRGSFDHGVIWIWNTFEDMPNLFLGF